MDAILINGPRRGQVVTVGEETQQIVVALMRHKCEHAPEPFEGVQVTYTRILPNERAFTTEQDVDDFGWWCQQCEMDYKAKQRKAARKEALSKFWPRRQRK